MKLADLVLDRDGAQLRAAQVDHVVDELREICARLPFDVPGVRLANAGDLGPHLRTDGAIGGIAASALEHEARPVRAILFDKSKSTNWSLGWHQDRTICVRERREVPGFGRWTTKSGRLHVSPPTAVLGRMVTVRVHLDDVPMDNAPLMIALGSHKLGLVAEKTIDTVVARSTVAACLARLGDVWIYATPILHASKAAERPSQRRVLQVDFASDDLPGGLEWAGL